jgi:hypothetical protein
LDFVESREFFKSWRVLLQILASTESSRRSGFRRGLAANWDARVDGNHLGKDVENGL